MFFPGLNITFYVLYPFVTYLLTLPHRTLVGKPEGKRPLGRPRCRCMDNIKMDLREIRWSGMVQTDLAQDRD
jgi:hypothetical protein